METSELLKKVRKIEIKTRGLSNQIFAGEYHTAFKGRGMTFSEVRDYQFGDDIRSIDWKVSARMRSPHIKTYEEERELSMTLLLDMSASGFFGTSGMDKQSLMVEIAAILAFSAIQNNDKVGALFFTNKVEKYIPPKKGKSHILRIIREMLNFEPQQQGTNIKQALDYLNSVTKKRNIVFLLSDFMDENYDKKVKMTAVRHDLVGIQLSDSFEQALPKIGLAAVVDPETGEQQWINTNDRTLQQHFSDWYQNLYRTTKSCFEKSGAQFVQVFTHEDYVKSLIKLFKTRSNQR